jgi:hypothetical protein
VVKKITREELKKSHPGDLAEYIYHWNEGLTGEDIEELFWLTHKPEDVKRILETPEVVEDSE